VRFLKTICALFYMYRRVLRSVALLFLISPIVAQAAVIAFDHIEYDPAGADSGHEWVRIHNVSGAALDLANWRFVESGTKHKLKPLSTSVVPVDGYAVIADNAAQYVAEHGAGTDVVFDSAFSLSNTGEVLAFTDASSTIVLSESYIATPKPVTVPTPAKVSSASATKSSKKSAPRVLEKQTPQITASVADAPATHDYSFWPWLAAAVLIGAGGGGALWYVRRGRSETGYTVIDISDKHV
jgi:hypothetical protein